MTFVFFCWPARPAWPAALSHGSDIARPLLMMDGRCGKCVVAHSPLGVWVSSGGQVRCVPRMTPADEPPPPLDFLLDGDGTFPVTQLHAEEWQWQSGPNKRATQGLGNDSKQSRRVEIGVLSNPTWLINASELRDFRGIGSVTRSENGTHSSPGPAVHLSDQDSVT